MSLTQAKMNCHPEILTLTMTLVTQKLGWWTLRMLSKTQITSNIKRRIQTIHHLVINLLQILNVIEEGEEEGEEEEDGEE